MFGPAYIKEYKTNFKLAYPVILGQIGHMATQIADSIMVGSLGAEVLAASSYAGMLFLVILLTLIGLATALTTLVGKARGEGSDEAVVQILGNSFWAALFFSALSVAASLLARPLLYHLGQEPEVVDIALPYYSILCWSAIPLIVFLSLKHFIEGLEWTKPGMVVSILANGINILLNYILIYGKLGFNAYGIEGAGYATLISRVFMAIALVLLVLSHSRLSPYKRALIHFKWSIKRLKELFTIGIPIGLQYLLEGGAFIAGTIIVGWLGAAHLAAHQIALSVSSFTYMFAMGLGATATIRISNLSGAGKIAQLKIVSYSLLVMMIVVESAFVIAIIALQKVLPGFYVDEPDVILIAGKLLVIAAFFQLSDGIQVLAMSALRGLSDVKIPTWIALLAYWVISIPVGYFIMEYSPHLSKGIWFGFLIGLSIAAVLLTLRYKLLLARLEQSVSVENKHP